MKSVIISALVFSLSLLVAGSALSSTVFDSTDLYRNKGKKHTSVHGFTADPSIPSLLEITKLSDSADYKKGRVKLNGTVFRLKDFLRSEETSMVLETELLERNRLKIVFKGSENAGLRVSVRQLNPPAAFLQSSPESIQLGETSELTWKSENADSCSLSPDIGAVDCNGSILVSPAGTTEYSFTAINSITGESAIAKETVGVTLVVPSASLEATPDSIQLGKKTMLSWTSADADECTLTPDIGVVDCTGSMEVFPAGSTHYIFTARNSQSGLMDSDVASVDVNVTVPNAQLSAEPDEIELGRFSMLTWSSTGADDCTLTPDVGSVPCSGVMMVSPYGTTNYIFTAKNSVSGLLGAALTTVNVRVTMPEASITADPQEIVPGQYAQLTWTATNADKCSLSPNVGPVDCNGTMMVSPQETVNYIFTAINSVSNTADSATVGLTVQKP